VSAVLQPQAWFEPMTENDLESVMAIERRIYAFPWTYGNFRDSIRSGYQCVVYRSRDGLLGYAVLMVGAGEAHLLNLSIAEEVQRRGHGERLLHYCTGLARANRATRLFLEVRPSNEAARQLYLRHGFERIGVRREYYPADHGREDALVLARELLPADP
jgi:ribosomal-protein-alanine N-acetyltransferase